ncbi:MAG TPA: heparinase II/III family protein [Bryobacteraceae bacterium]|nr:heparinase II/III family protein [Bryobacteraceae bacterium]
MTQTRRTFVAGSGVALASAQSTARGRPGAQRVSRKNLLSTAWPAGKVGRVLIARDRWKPFATASERARWEGLPVELRGALIAAGETALAAGPWPALPATLFLEFARVGNRSHYEAVWRQRRNRLRDLVLAECTEGQARFLDEIANGIWLTCEETFWGYPAHLNLQKRGGGLPDVTEPVIDLFAAETGAELAWTSYLLGPQLEKVHPLVTERIGIEMERRILAPFRTREDWWWMGFSSDNSVNNWNPWINSNVLTSALLFEPQATRAAFVHKVLRSVDRFLDGYDEDGGCDEGPSYWGRAGASLFENLELLYSASAGAIDFYSVPLVREIGRYIYRVQIHDNWYVNFADASARVGIAGDLVYRYGARIGDADMQALGAWAAKSGPERSDLGRQLPALFNTAIAEAEPRQPLVQDAWMPGIQVMTARMKAGEPAGLYLAAQGGHNAESHNHNDVGNFIVYSDGEPAIIDVGVETYSAKTFSARRYEIWTMQSAYHNLPTINGVMQSAGREFAARGVYHKSDNRAAEFSLEIAGAYPKEAGIESWRRTLRLDRTTGHVELRDSYALAKSGARIALTLMTPCEVKVAAGRLALADRAVVEFDAGTLRAEVETIKVEDGRLSPVWGQRVYRILLTNENAPAKGEFTLRIARR